MDTGCASDAQIAVGASNTIQLLWANDDPIQDLILDLRHRAAHRSLHPRPGSSRAYFIDLSGTSSSTPQIGD